MIATLRKLSRSDLAELLITLTEDRSAVSEEEDTARLANRLVEELQRLTGAEGTNDFQLERVIVSRLVNVLGIDYSPGMRSQEIASRIQTRISDLIVEDLRPFIQVAVCMGWADGRLSPEEIALVDAALSRLRILKRRRAELLGLCSSVIRPENIAEALESASHDDQKAWSLLALGWAVAMVDLKTHPKEVSVFYDLAAHLGINKKRAEHIRELVGRRFRDSLVVSGVPTDATEPKAPRTLAKATMAAIMAAELDSYLHAITGLKTLSLLLGTPLCIGDHRDSVGALDTILAPTGWFGAPTILAGTLFLRRLGNDTVNVKLLVLLLTCLERAS